MCLFMRQTIHFSRGYSERKEELHIVYFFDVCAFIAGISSSCDSWAEQDIDEVESKNSKKSRKRKGSKQSKGKGKEQNFLKRNIEVK